MITILFTVGYASQPLFTTTIRGMEPSPSSDPVFTAKSDFYIGKVSNDLINPQGFYSSATSNYTDINNDLAILFQTLLYTCIAITIGLVAGIVLGYFGLKMISKIVFFLVLVLMIAIFIIIQVIILSDSFINNVTSTLGLSNASSTNVENGNGYYLILASTALMFVTYIVYAFLA